MGGFSRDLSGYFLNSLKKRMELKDYNQSRLEFMYMIKISCETSKHYQDEKTSVGTPLLSG